MVAASLDDQATLAEIAGLHHRTGYLADPHTAVGIGAARACQAGGRAAVPVVCMATAHPAKFPGAVEQATGVRPRCPPPGRPVRAARALRRPRQRPPRRARPRGGVRPALSTNLGGHGGSSRRAPAPGRPLLALAACSGGGGGDDEAGDGGEETTTTAEDGPGDRHDARRQRRGPAQRGGAELRRRPHLGVGRPRGGQPSPTRTAASPRPTSTPWAPTC